VETKSISPMRFRKLRIAFSIACIVPCVLLVELWVRSYWWSDSAYGYLSSARQFELNSELGSFTVGVWDCDRHLVPTVSSYLMTEPSEAAPFGFRMDESPGEGFGYGFYSPYWLAVLLGSGVAAAPWIKWRFSLRTLVLATTLVAVVLGLIVWLR
jgi:hypothetical protein